jgi:hypothetical protein
VLEYVVPEIQAFAQLLLIFVPLALQGMTQEPVQMLVDIVLVVKLVSKPIMPIPDVDVTSRDQEYIIKIKTEMV